MTVSAMPPTVVAEAAAAAREWLRVPAGPDDPDDATLATLAASALALAEAFCGRVLIARAATEPLTATGGWQRLAHAPVTVIGPVAAGEPPAALPVADYAIDIDRDGTGWIRLAAPAGADPTAAYAVGDADDWATLPAPVAQGVVMLVAHLYDGRDGDAGPPPGVAALWRPWRRLALAVERHS